MKLAAAWASVMFMYAYADLLGFYDRTLIESILNGNMPVFGRITPAVRLGIAVMMSVPAIMIFASAVVRRNVARWANMIAGVGFSLVIVATLIMGPPLYYRYFGVLEVALTVYVAWTAYRWGRQGQPGASDDTWSAGDRKP
jgi:hypothetical protein